MRGAEAMRRVQTFSHQLSQNIQTINIPGAVYAEASAINNQDQIVGPADP